MSCTAEVFCAMQLPHVDETTQCPEQKVHTFPTCWSRGSDHRGFMLAGFLTENVGA